MEINLKNNKTSLDNISLGDLLIFKDRKEIVEKVDREEKKLYTQRKKVFEDFVMTERILYQTEEIKLNSPGRIYDWIKK